MIVDYVEGNKWLKAAMNPQYRLYMSQDDIVEIIHDNRVCGFSSRYFDENNKDITFYKPFFAAIQNDIYESAGSSCFGSLRMWCHWPYNETIEADLKKKVKNFKGNHYWYNKYTEVEFEKSDDFGYLGELMNQFGYYEQAYQDDYSVRLYHFAYHSHCQSFGGICLFIEKETNNIFIFGIGEDDGWMFPETYCYHDYEISGINTFEFWRLCSMVNDINVLGIDNQAVIEKLYEQHKNE